MGNFAAMDTVTTASEILEVLSSMACDEQRRVLMRFFKTGPGEYGEGDEFFGIKVPQTRAVVKEARGTVPFAEIERLLYSRWHEARLCGFLLLVEEMKAATPRRRDPDSHGAERRQEIAAFYLRHARQANNWDLVDLSCSYIIGVWLLHQAPGGNMPDRGLLDRLAESSDLWEQRIAIVSTAALIRAGEYADTLRIATRLLGHDHDLIHKAVGWMLREVGKRDADLLRTYLDANLRRMHRTTLRYAIERLPAPERQAWLRR